MGSYIRITSFTRIDFGDDRECFEHVPYNDDIFMKHDISLLRSWKLNDFKYGYSFRFCFKAFKIIIDNLKMTPPLDAQRFGIIKLLYVAIVA